MKCVSRLVSFLCLAAILVIANIPYQIAAANPSPIKLYYDLGGEGGWVPYRTGASRGQPGILEELTFLLETYSNIEFESVNLPMKRAEKALKDGIVDFDFICPEWFENNDFGSQFVISNPLFEINEYVVTLKGNAHLFPTLDAIHKKRIGTIAGYFYFDDSEFRRVDFLDETTLVLGLKERRFDAIILEGETARYWAKINEVEIEFATLHSTGKLSMRLKKRNKVWLTEINSAIEKVKKSGELSKILDKHNVVAKIY